MNTFNNFSPLAFREKSMKATYKKWYAYGKEFALPFSTTELPPFQFTVANLPSFDPTTVEVFLVNEATGTRGATGIKIKVDAMDGHGSVLYVSPGSNVYAKSIEPGVYRAEFAIPEGETYVSTPICVTEGIETNTNFVKLEYWNDEKLAYPNGFVTTGTNNDFKFQMYIPTTFFKPKYEFEEEITKRAGYKFLELQTCNKVFGFNFLAPEYICDALRLVRLSDYIRFTHDGEYYNALNFEYNPDWQDNGYLAAIECQFETDTIIQKLPSFNRRDRESFYNALLADIDTPILFSPDVVGLYYREFKQGEPTIKGKLIRELSPIDLIDENTTIAVDMGAGEARKYNLYRMLEGYISKNHEDVTEFLLSLRGGVNIGTPNSSGEHPASVDRYGNAKLKDIQGNDATLKTVETGFLTVNKTSATINGMGNANVNDLTARGDSMLRSDVYTGSKNGSHTGKITKEGQLQYLSAIIYEFLSSETFVPGFLGEGFKIWVENGNWNIECDNLTVRQTMNVFELLIQKIRSVNGAIVVSQSNGKVTAVEDTGTQYKITFGEEFPTFQEGDLIRCQAWSKNNIKFYWVEVKSAADGYVLCDKSEFNNVVPAVDDEVVQMGNTKNAERQALIYITAQESGKPYIEILNGVKTKSLTGTDRTRLGDLSNIVDPDFTGEAAVKGTGFYSTNAFLKGIFVLRNGKRVEDEIKIAKDAADQAAKDAANAAQSAQEAKDRLNKWADDGLISPTEKPALIDEGKRIQAEYLQIKANADKYGVPVTEYTEAYNNYLNELRYHSAATPEDIAVRPELAQSQTIYYDRRNGALNAIANAAKSYVDEADKKLKEYLDTEITAIPGKISLSVTTELNKRVIGGANLILKSGTCVSGVYRIEYFYMSQYFRDLRGKKVTISFDYEYSNLELGGNNRIGLEEPVLKDGTSEYYRVGTFKYFNSLSPKAEKGRFVNTITIPEDIVNSQNKGIALIIQVGNSTNMKVCNPQIEIGDTATGWSPAPEDGVNQSIEYTKSQIDVVEKKIELKVSSTTYENGIKRADSISRLLSNSQMLDAYSDVNFSNGKNNLNVYDNAGSGQVVLDVIDNNEAPNSTHKVLRVRSAGTATSPGAGGFHYGLQTEKNKVFIFRFTAKLAEGKTIEWASNAAGTDYQAEWLTSKYGTGKWEEYIVAVYCGSTGTFGTTSYFYVAEGGAYEMLISYASAFLYNGDNAFVGKKTYETKITQLDQSISLKASQTDLNSTTERVRQAEIKLDSTSVKLGVVEGTANSANTAAGNAQNTANAANSLAGTANSKADATNNGLVETGINITSRKIVLKSDNVLFQNNAGQQTAAINANGKLTANAIEVGEVVAGGFAAQRITTGNLTVTDGAVIAGMSISRGVLRGSNVELTNGAKIGSFIISNGIFSAQGVPAGIQMSLSSNLSTFDSSGVKIDHNSGGYALTTNGNGRVYLKGSAFWAECQDYEFIGATSWKAPGVFCAASITAVGSIYSTWGNPDFHITRVTLTATGEYTITFTGNRGAVYPMVVAYGAAKWGNAFLTSVTSSEVRVKIVDVNKGAFNSNFFIYFCGMV